MSITYSKYVSEINIPVPVSLIQREICTYLCMKYLNLDIFHFIQDAVAQQAHLFPERSIRLLDASKMPFWGDTFLDNM